VNGLEHPAPGSGLPTGCATCGSGLHGVLHAAVRVIDGALQSWPSTLRLVLVIAVIGAVAAFVVA
jgi:hypothetical protein